MDLFIFGPALAAVFMVGLLGGVHCMGMCGGIVAALSGSHSGLPSSLQAGSHSGLQAGRTGRAPVWRVQLAFNAGRIAIYALAGALAGAAGFMALFLNDLLPVQLVMYVFANLMLVGLGLYLLGITRYIRIFERAGAVLWRQIQPVTRHVLPANTVPRALLLGMLWGWMPCGLVYSMLATALVAGNAVQGAALLAAFGLGTLPNLLFAGALMRWLSARRVGAWMRGGAGASPDQSQQYPSVPARPVSVRH